jgi:hypothetical protein
VNAVDPNEPARITHQVMVLDNVEEREFEQMAFLEE